MLILISLFLLYTFSANHEAIQWRTGLRFLNEAARCLEESIITSPVTILVRHETSGDIFLSFRLMVISVQSSALDFLR